jgi:hypothetical protein
VGWILGFFQSMLEANWASRKLALVLRDLVGNLEKLLSARPNRSFTGDLRSSFTALLESIQTAHAILDKWNKRGTIAKLLCGWKQTETVTEVKDEVSERRATFFEQALST